jgi:uncharacterized protein
MSQAAKAPEPSMEEILASIRRIIAEDENSGQVSPQTQASANAVRAHSGKPAHSDEPSPMSQNDIDTMLSGFGAGPKKGEGDAAAESRPRDLDEVLELTEEMEAPPENVRMAGFRTIEATPDLVFEDRAEPAETAASLLSENAHSAVTSAFNSLAHTVLAQNARTLEDLVREMLRPMLKSWLDENLPTIVERLVRAEIERVSRGR